MGRTVSGAERASGFEAHPEHTVVCTAAGGHVRVSAGGEVIAETDDAIALREAGYPLVYYVPRHAVRMDLLSASDHHTFCPFKGDASYWSLRAGASTLDNAVWSYEDPFVEVAEIKDYLAFYPTKTTVEVT